MIHVFQSYWAKAKHKWKHIRAKKHLYATFPDDAMAPIKQKNRAALHSISTWIDAETLERSVFQYGIPAEHLPKLNLPTDHYTTYTDIIAFLTDRMGAPIRYLEVGVSVGKNFWQIANYVENAIITGLDVEELNPTIRDRFECKEREMWTGDPSLLRPQSSTAIYRYHSNTIRYHCMDEFDETGWQRMSGEKFNVYFSDAFHNPEALRFEYQMLKKYNLLDENEFVMIWDDLGGAMEEVFLEIFNDVLAKGKPVYKYRFITNGWVNEKNHQIGIITTLRL